MTNKGAVTGTINPRGEYTIPAGYHNGSGKATCSTCESNGYKKIQVITQENLSWNKVDSNDINTLSPNSMTRICPSGKMCQSVWEFPLESGKTKNDVEYVFFRLSPKGTGGFEFSNSSGYWSTQDLYAENNLRGFNVTSASGGYISLYTNKTDNNTIKLFFTINNANLRVDRDRFNIKGVIIYK